MSRSRGKAQQRWRGACSTALAADACKALGGGQICRVRGHQLLGSGWTCTDFGLRARHGPRAGRLGFGLDSSSPSCWARQFEQRRRIAVQVENR